MSETEVSGAEGRMDWGVTTAWYGVSFGDDENVLELHSDNNCITL